ncbi:uncharacterized protein JCM6883_005922 [Sporobolomyces salmoneus]|uniref:uncharacterized protein n=1 Tax=Sporobolomyces salmoneus TaxID=183962 RepID=UPI00317B77B5
MSLFNKSYATSEQLELSRIAASSSPSAPPFDSQQQSTSLLRSTRNIPAELRAPPYNPQQEELLAVEEAEEEVDPFGRRNKAEKQGEPSQAEDIFEDHDASNSTNSATDSQEKERKRARTSQIGKMLFPPSTRLTATTEGGSPKTKRHSYSGNISTSPQFSLNPLSASTSSLPIATSRIPTHTLRDSAKKTLSPTNKHRRTTSLTTTTSSSSSSHSSNPSSSSLSSLNDGTLLALPLAKQLQSLKERNLALAQSSSTTNAKLVKATDRIRQLEETLSAVESSRAVDAEGWEAEASRLAQELSLLQKHQLDQPNVGDLESRLSTAERNLAVEQSKKKRAKELIGKLKCELINRRWKEKYEIELLEKEERHWEIKVVETECELAILRGELGCERAEREELESIVATQKKRISALTASRQVLLDSFNTSEETISSLRVSLSQTQSTVAERDESIQDLNIELESLRDELEVARSKGGEGEAKIQEKSSNLEAEVKDLKAQLKTSQATLKTAQKSATSTTSDLESTREALSTLQAKYDALLASAKAQPLVAAKDKKRPQPVVPEPEEEDDEQEEVVEPSPKRTKVKEAKPAPRKKKVEKVIDEDIPPRAVEKPSKPTKSSKAVGKKVVPEPEPSASEAEDNVPEEEEEEDDDPTPRPTPVSPPPAAIATGKKRKAAVLSDKTTNSTKEKGTTSTTTKVKKDKTGAGGGKKKLSLDLSEDERPAPKGKEKEKEEPAKKKKRKLFGDTTKKGFDWQTQIENADVNGLIPGNLSPIKLDRTKKTGFLNLGGAGAKKSIF